VIPKILHLIWISHPLKPKKEMPENCAAFYAKWKALHPHWDVRLWGNEIYERYASNTMLARMMADPAQDEAKLTNIIRFLLLRDFGGLYSDIDVEPFKCFDPLTELQTTAVLGMLSPGDRSFTQFDPSVCMYAPNHPHLTRILDVYFHRQYAPRCGLLMHMLSDDIDETYTILSYKHFMAHERHPETYCLHWPNRLASWKVKKPVYSRAS
jgi:mannosyltransferase OCH1-like enzyme